MLQFVTAVLLFFTSPVSAAFLQPNYSLGQTAIPTQSPCVLYKMISVTINTKTQPLITCATTQQGLSPFLNALYGQVEFHTKESILWPGKKIVATPVQKMKTLVVEAIIHPVEVTYTKSLPHKKKVITQKGKNGTSAKIIETTTYPDGKKVSVVLDSWIEHEAISEQATIGTIYDYKTAVVDGKVIQYWKTLTVKATSYDSSCLGCNHTTATGAYLKKGIVAVDPRVIPMHTKMYIPGYGFGQAEDTGGRIRGNRIDLAFDDIRFGNWSKRDVTIYILD